jgi:hypothetical protein
MVVRQSGWRLVKWYSFVIPASDLNSWIFKQRYDFLPERFVTDLVDCFFQLCLHVPVSPAGVS